MANGGGGLNGFPLPKDLPDYSNERTRAAEAKLQPFIYDPELANSPTFKDVISRGPYQLDNGAVYIGEWNAEGLR